MDSFFVTTVGLSKCACLALCLFWVSNAVSAQQKDEFSKLAQDLRLSLEQKNRVLQIDLQYQKDMYGLKEQAENRYYSPARIQYHHTSCLVLRIQALIEILTPKQYTRIIQDRFDVYPERAWLAAFYKDNQLPTIEQAVFKKLSRLLSGKNELKERVGMTIQTE